VGMRDPLTLIGIGLVLVGIILILGSLMLRHLPEVREVHPLLFVSVRVGDLTIGTSPLLILVLLALYLLLMWSRA
jgi:hypothetical protein